MLDVRVVERVVPRDGPEGEQHHAVHERDASRAQPRMSHQSRTQVQRRYGRVRRADKFRERRHEQGRAQSESHCDARMGYAGFPARDR